VQSLANEKLTSNGHNKPPAKNTNHSTGKHQTELFNNTTNCNMNHSPGKPQKKKKKSPIRKYYFITNLMKYNDTIRLLSLILVFNQAVFILL
jgi:hypothetical protein